MFSHPEFDDHESVTYVADEASGLRAIIAIHSTILGPAGGGVRMYPYATEGEALTDALRLSQGMTLKAAIADLPFGGGKSVILGDPATKTEAMFEAFGQAVADLGGRYFCGEDVGTSPADMAVINRRTTDVVGLPGKTGDPSPATARTVFVSMQAAVAHTFDGRDLAGLHVVLQGVGHVGRPLAELLYAAGARLTVADINAGAVQWAQDELGAAVASPEEIHRLDADVFAPCALGAVINDATLDDLNARIICGSANNQLASPRHGRLLHRAGIVYVPDYVANAGGAISALRERVAYGPGEYEARLAGVGARVGELLERSTIEDIPPSDAADELAREIVAAAA